MSDAIREVVAFATDTATRTPLLLLFVVAGIALVGGVIPGIPVEAVLLGAAAIAPDAILLPLVIVTTVGQMIAKTSLCAGAGRLVTRLSDARRLRIDRTCAALARWPRLQLLTLLGSASVGLPPFYVTAIAFGMLRMPLRTFVAIGTIGRALRFGAVVLAPGLLGAQPARDAGSVSIAGVSIAGARVAGGDTWVLLNGTVGGVAGFRRLESRLIAHGGRVLIIDAFRLSADATDVSFAALARRVDSVLAAHGVDQAHVVGHAHGAGIALRLAAHAPHRVATLTLLDAGALPAQASRELSAALRLVPLIARVPGGQSFLRSRLERGLRENAGRDGWLDAATLHAYTEPLLRDVDRVIALAYRLARSREPEALADVVARVRAPLLVIVGTVPRPAGPAESEFDALAPLGTRLRRVALDGVGHFVHEEAPDEVMQLLLPLSAPHRIATRPSLELR